ncbi:hypothetical protein C3Y91_11265 [Rhizobium sp. UPM1133]|nr:hypothetical protein [Rhizobium ruizarguesonis]
MYLSLDMRSGAFTFRPIDGFLPGLSRSKAIRGQFGPYGLSNLIQTPGRCFCLIVQYARWRLGGPKLRASSIASGVRVDQLIYVSFPNSSYSRRTERRLILLETSSTRK